VADGRAAGAAQTAKEAVTRAASEGSVSS
jgi:hypothetical protein